MKISVAHCAMMVAAFGALTALPAHAESDARAEIKALLARVKALEAKVARQEKETAHATNVANAASAAAAVVKGPLVAPGIPPVVVTFTNGLKVETLDKDWSFKIGGRIFVDGGASSQPFTGKSGNVGIRRARLEVEGRAAKVWFYKLQYDFAGTVDNSTVFTPIGIAGCSQTITAAGLPTTVNCGGGTINSIPSYSYLGGMRDAYLGTDSPWLTTPLSKDPAWIMVGNQYEPSSGLELITSSKYIDFIERSLATDTFGANRHIGASIGLRGDVWTWKGGIFSTSPEDRALAPPAQNGAPLVWATPAFTGGGTPTGPLGVVRNYTATGGGQYFDLSTRFTVAPILNKEEGQLIHFGGWFRYHQPNSSNGANDDRVMLLGSNTRSEANILGEGLVGTPDLSCGFVAQNYAQTITRSVLAGPLVSGNCVKNMEAFGLEAVGAYGPFSVQGEYMHQHYNRDWNQLLYASTVAAFVNPPTSLNGPSNGVWVPGGTSMDFTGFYVYTTVYLTGESRAEAYNVKDKNGAAFEQIKILHPFSQGGWGAWELAARLSSVNLNSGPISGQSYVNAMNAAGAAAAAQWNAGASPTNAYLVRAAANSGIVGGRQNDFTLGLNWYPDRGIRFMANWIRVVNLSAPYNAPWEQGSHPNLFMMRAQIDW